jgi:hypothetical protein
VDKAAGPHVELVDCKQTPSFHLWENSKFQPIGLTMGLIKGIVIKIMQITKIHVLKNLNLIFPNLWSLKVIKPDKSPTKDDNNSILLTTRNLIYHKGSSKKGLI